MLRGWRPAAVRFTWGGVTPKYRRKVIYNQIRSDLGEIFRKLCHYKGIEIIEGHLMPDHVHMLLAMPPKYSVSSVMGYLKGKSSLMVFDRHANMKYKFGNRKFWAEGHCVSTVGLNEATIAKYIREQEKADIRAIQRRGCALREPRVRAHRHDSGGFRNKDDVYEDMYIYYHPTGRSSTQACRTAPWGRGRWFSMVPEAGFEPAHLSATVFETVVSAVPPLGLRGTSAV